MILNIAYMVKFVNKQFRDVLAMLEKDHTNELKTFLYKTKKVDKVRGEDWLDVFPELKDML